MHKNKIALLVLLPAALVLTAGCIERSMLIQSQPSGAQLYINGDEVGRTPVELPFKHYGTIEVYLQKDNFKTVREDVTLSTPWYAYFPLDFFTDVLYPGTLHDRKVITLEMSPVEPDIEELKERAEPFRDNAEKALAEEEQKLGISPNTTD